MKTRTQRALEMALKAINAIDSIKEKLKKEDIGPKFRTRAERAATMIPSLGLIPTLSFFYSKAGTQCYSELARIYDNGEVNVDKLNLDALKDDISPEKISYGLYLRFILAFLKEEGVISSDDINKAFEEFSKDPMKVYLATKVLEPFLLECKKLASAMYKEER